MFTELYEKALFFFSKRAPAFNISLNLLVVFLNELSGAYSLKKLAIGKPLDKIGLIIISCNLLEEGIILYHYAF